MYDINSNLLQKTGLSAGQLQQAVNALRPGHGFNDFQAFVDAENTYGLNSLFMVAHAAIESAWVTSTYGVQRNNLFGFNAIDSNPDQASRYASQRASIDYYASFLHDYYLTPPNGQNGKYGPIGIYYNGATPHGVFVKYSSSHDAEANSVVGIMNNLLSHISGAPAPGPTPGPSPSGNTGSTVTVGQGDTLSGIAARHGMSLGQIEALNPQAGHPSGNFGNIWPGDHIVISGSPAPAPAPSGGGGTTHTVAQGESMSVIAQKHNMTLGQLEALNPNSGHPAGNYGNIWPGDVLNVSPGPAAPPTPAANYHSVGQGETLSGIAGNYGISLARIKQLNPGAGHPAGNFDKIFPGDSIRVS